MMVIRNDGTVNWNPSVQLKAWCANININHWPNDEHKCDLIFKFGRVDDQLAITFLVLPIVMINQIYRNDNVN